MTELANFFSPFPVYTIVSIGTAGIIGFLLGYLLRSGIIISYKKKILNLEDEMLASHSRILELEKENAELKSEKLIMNGKPPASPKKESKTS